MESTRKHALVYFLEENTGRTYAIRMYVDNILNFQALERKAGRNAKVIGMID